MVLKCREQYCPSNVVLILGWCGLVIWLSLNSSSNGAVTYFFHTDIFSCGPNAEVTMKVCSWLRVHGFFTHY